MSHLVCQDQAGGWGVTLKVLQAHRKLELPYKGSSPFPIQMAAPDNPRANRDPRVSALEPAKVLEGHHASVIAVYRNSFLELLVHMAPGQHKPVPGAHSIVVKGTHTPQTFMICNTQSRMSGNETVFHAYVRKSQVQDSDRSNASLRPRRPLGHRQGWQQHAQIHR